MAQDITRSIEACAAHYGDEAKAVKKYLIEGQAKALALPNRGPLTFDSNGNVSHCLLYTSPSPRDATLSRMPSSA